MTGPVLGRRAWPRSGDGLFVFCLALTALGCGFRAPPSQSDPASSRAPSEEPVARWEYRPEGSASFKFVLDLSGGGRLWVDALGGRTYDKSSERGDVAPEVLTGVIERAGRLHGISRLGRTYVTSAPLSPWTTAFEPPELFTDSAISPRTGEFLGLSADGALWVSKDLGASWKKSEAAPFFTALEAGAEGVYLASLPESYLLREANGELKVLPATFGGASFERGPDLRLGLEGPSGFVPLEKESAFSPRAELVNSIYLRASSVRAGHAASSPSGDAVSFVKQKDGGFRLWRGSLAKPLVETDVTLACEPKRVALGDGGIFAICESRAGRERYDFLYAPVGEPFEKLWEGLRGDSERLRMAVKGERLAWLGFCPPGENEPGCSPLGVFWGSARDTRSVAIPIPEATSALELAFAGDGALLVLTQRPRDQHLLLYRVTEAVAETSKASARGTIKERAEDPPRFSLSSLDLSNLLPGSLGPLQSVALFPSDGPVTGVAIGDGEKILTAALNAQLHLVGVGTVPEANLRLGGYGDRILGIQESTGRVIESLDGGLSWRRSEVPALRGKLGLHHGVSCAQVGCVFGDELFRRGYGTAARSFAATANQESEERAGQPHLGARISCDAAGAPRIPLDGANSRPTAHDAARGDVFWSQVASRSSDGSAWIYQARFGARDIERVSLLRAVSGTRGLAMTVSEQVEGAAALRYLWRSEPRGQRVLSSLEVAWDNRMLGQTCFGRLPFDVPGSARDYEVIGDGRARARPALLSISGETLYLELSGRGPGQSGLFAFDECGKSHRIIEAVPPEPADPRVSEREIIRGKDQDIFLRLSRDGFIVAATGSEGRSRTMRLAGVPERSDLVFSVNLGYLGTVPLFTAIIADTEGRFWRAESLPIEELLSPRPPRRVRAALLSDATDPLRPCAASERKDTVRVVSPAFPRGEREVIVKTREGQRRLVVGRAVVHGTPEDPCIAALEAFARVPGGRDESDETELGALIDVTGEGVSWLFEEKKSERGSSLSALALGCSTLKAESTELERESSSADDARNVKDMPGAEPAAFALVNRAHRNL